MKIFLATTVLLSLATAAQAGAPQASAHRVVSSSSRYWLSDDLNRLVFWRVRAPAQGVPAPAEVVTR